MARATKRGTKARKVQSHPKPNRPRRPSVRRRRAPPSDKAAVLGAALVLANAIRRGKVETAKQFLAREFTFIDAAGKVHSRREVLNNLQPGPTVADMKETVRTYGDVALITGALKSAQAKERQDLFALDVWVKGKDGWQALVHHDNVLAPEGCTACACTHRSPRPPDAPPPECKNPLQVVPYEPKSQAERDVIKAFQTDGEGRHRERRRRMGEARRRRVRGLSHRPASDHQGRPRRLHPRRRRRSTPRPSWPRSSA